MTRGDSEVAGEDGALPIGFRCSSLRLGIIDSLQDLLHAGMQLVKSLPEIAEAAHHPKLQELLTKHLQQTEEHVEHLRSVFELLHEKRSQNHARE